MIKQYQISKASIDSYSGHDDFVSVNNVLREYYEIEEGIKNPETSVRTYHIKTLETWKLTKID